MSGYGGGSAGRSYDSGLNGGGRIWGFPSDLLLFLRGVGGTWECPHLGTAYALITVAAVEHTSFPEDHYGSKLLPKFHLEKFNNPPAATGKYNFFSVQLSF